MARNEEKANAVLNRFWAAKQEEKQHPREKRPFLASECRDLADADKWRQQILREIGRKVLEIQNPGLGEHRLKDLNDEINKLVREKGHWEVRIVELGGPNYAKMGPKITDDEGREIDPASGKGLGYRYFGAAKQLPGVKELFEMPAVPKKKRSRYELFKRINMDYYGYRDEEDGVLERVEKVAEEEMVKKTIEEWERIEEVKEEARRSVKSGEVGSVLLPGGGEEEGDLPRELEGNKDEEGEDDEEEDGVGGQVGRKKERLFVAHVPLPDEREIEKMVMEKKKAELLSKYASESLVEEEVEAKSLLNIKD